MKMRHSSPIVMQVCLLFSMLLVSGFITKVNAQTQLKPFTALVSADESNRYFEADLSQLPSFFEKAYFLDLVFKDTIVVVQNSSLKNKLLPFLCNAKYDTKQVLTRMEDIKTSVLKSSASMSESEKSKTIKKFEKYR
jgi:hypothetical protein